VGAAILLGDLALVWSDELLHTADRRTDRVTRVLELVDAMRNEVVYGQYLDLLSAGRLFGDIEAAVRIARYKTAKYTVERPLHIGAALADAEPVVLEACTAFALPLGEAFQLRDDLLGVYGDPAETGKPMTDDIREGKATVLMALAARRACGADLKLLQATIGNADVTAKDVERLRLILDATGARRTVEQMIQHRREQALAVLDEAPFSPAAVRLLRDLAQKATVRRA
jgi:geranylgeranyl diphosphate synthase type I